LNLYLFQTLYHLGNERYMTMQSFNDELRVHFRQYKKIGWKVYPTKQGITLTRSQFETLYTLIDKVNDDINSFKEGELSEFKYELGNGVRLSGAVQYPLIHIRYHFKNDEMPIALPTKCGIGLRLSEWETFVTLMKDLCGQLLESEGITEYTKSDASHTAGNDRFTPLVVDEEVISSDGKQMKTFEASEKTPMLVIPANPKRLKLDISSEHDSDEYLERVKTCVKLGHSSGLTGCCNMCEKFYNQFEKIMN